MSYKSTKIPRVRSGHPITATAYNRLVDAVNQLQVFRGDGRYISIDNINGSVQAKWIGPAISKRRGVANSLFAVLVWRDGGTTDGDQSSQCDRTYTVRTLGATGPSSGGRELGTGMTPKKVRPSIGKMVTPSTSGAGVEGLGYYDASGSFALYDANEILDTGACS